MEGLITNGWVQESFSAYSSPIVWVRKKDGGGGGYESVLVIVKLEDYAGFTTDSMNPRLIDNLGKESWFSAKVCQRHTIPSGIYFGRFASQHQTSACATPWALFDWIRILFGLHNEPHGFQQYINQCLGWEWEPYLDDILGYSKTFEEHLDDTRKIFQCLIKHGIKLRVDKCVLFK